MDEPRDTPAVPESGKPVAVSTNLPPTKLAWQAFVHHARGCIDCHDPDRHCTTADDLWKAWHTEANRAMDELRVNRRPEV